MHRWIDMELELAIVLRLAWIAAILPILIASIPISKLNWLRDLVSSFAKRGKTLQSSSSSSSSSSSKFFCHFYALAVVWTTFLLVTTWFYAYNVAPLVSDSLHFSSITSYLTGGSRGFWLHRSSSMTKEKGHGVWLSVFMLLLMEFQVIRRLYESTDVFHYSPSARMHILGYITGLYFYTAAPLSLCCTYVAEVFQFAPNLLQELVVKAKDQMHFTETNWWGYVYPLMTLKWHAWLGSAIFLLGWIHQLRCHAILGLLREQSVGTDDYAIPYGDWFRYVSSPHYLAEIVIYAGILVVSGCSDATIWLLFVFVVANLVFAAADTHQWYRRKFDNCPRDRFAIVPCVLERWVIFFMGI